LELSRQAPPPDAIIADYRLRGDALGIEAIQALQARFRSNIPAVLVTGDTAPDRLREATASGFRLLHKPVAPTKLRSLLTLVLEERANVPD
jgi:CheY-like chemotaxis protein